MYKFNADEIIKEYNKIKEERQAKNNKCHVLPSKKRTVAKDLSCKEEKGDYYLGVSNSSDAFEECCEQNVNKKNDICSCQEQKNEEISEVNNYDTKVLTEEEIDECINMFKLTIPHLAREFYGITFDFKRLYAVALLAYESFLRKDFKRMNMLREKYKRVKDKKAIFWYTPITRDLRIAFIREAARQNGLSYIVVNEIFTKSNNKALLNKSIADLISEAKQKKTEKKAEIVKNKNEIKVEKIQRTKWKTKNKNILLKYIGSDSNDKLEDILKMLSKEADIRIIDRFLGGESFASIAKNNELNIATRQSVKNHVKNVLLKLC